MSASERKPDGPSRPADIVVEFTQTGDGVPEGGKRGRVAQREGTLEPRLLLLCANPACRKGGFFLRPHIEKAVREGESEIELDIPCAGYIGARRSEKGPPSRCENRLVATVRFAYVRPAAGG